MSTWAGSRRTRSRGSRFTHRFPHCSYTLSPSLFFFFPTPLLLSFDSLLYVWVSLFIIASLVLLFVACVFVNGWSGADSSLCRRIDYYGVTFDHLVPSDDCDPETLQINIIETDDDYGAYANMHLLFPVDAGEYRGKKVLAVPRCCSKRKGTTDRARINESVIIKEKLALQQAKWREQGIYPRAEM